MSDILVSVVSPIFNMERYLREFLDSLAAQTLREAEFICIDDGSTDNSLKIIYEYARKDSRFRVISKENEGYGRTMNLGIDLAKGCYVGFLDPDDFCDPQTFETLFSQARAHGFPDIVKANYFKHSSVEGDVYVKNFPADDCGHVFELSDHPNTLKSTPTIWAAVYRTGFLKECGLRLTETPGVSYQDTAFVKKAWLASKSILLLHDAFVHYRIDNPKSSSKASGNVFRVCDEYDLVEAYMREVGKESWASPYVRASRVGAYLWNLGRLHGEERALFLARAQREFTLMRDSGLMEETPFTSWQLKTIDEVIQS